MNSDPAPSPEELRAAAALAQALDGLPSESAPGPELEVAHLLAAARDGTLGAGAQDRVLQAVMAELDASGGLGLQQGEAPPRRPGIWRRLRLWLLPAGGLAATAGTAAALLLTLSPGSAPAPAALPRPDAVLLRLQAEALAAPAADERYALALRGYRARLHADLARRHEDQR